MKRRPLLERISRGAKKFIREVTMSSELEMALKASGASAASNQFLDWAIRSISADDDIRRNSRRLRARARDLHDTTPYVQRALEVICDGIIGPTGPRMAAENKDERGNLLDDANEAIESSWKRWQRRPVTLDGKLPLVPFMRLHLATMFRDGEAFCRMWRGREYNEWGLALEPIDADLVDEQLNVPRSKGQNEIRLGIEVDDLGRAVAYHVLPELRYHTASRDHERIPADQVIHNFRPRRVGQTRGVSTLLPVMIALKMEQGHMEAELMACVIGAAKSFVYRQLDNASVDISEEDEKTGEFRTEVEPGLGWKLPAGWTVEMLKTDHPPTAYGDFQKSIIRKISIGFGMSYHTLSGDLESTSYSSGRIGMLQERDFYSNGQEFFFSQFLDQLCPAWLKVALLTEELQLDGYDPRRYQTVRWIGRGWSYVNPKEEIQANALALDNLLTSHSRLHAEMGNEFEEVLRERKRDRELVEKYGDSFPAQGGAQVPADTTPADAGAADGAKKPAPKPRGHLNGHSLNRLDMSLIR